MNGILRNLSLRRIASLVVLAPFSYAVANAGVVVTVTPWLAPNAFGSPSFAQAVANEQYAMMHGLSSYGAAGPTQYNAMSNVTSAQGIVTNFSSWMGKAEPGGAYANELGNRMTFGLSIVGSGGTQFSISDLMFSSSDTGGGALSAGFNHPAGYYNYSSGYEGVLYGADGKLGGGDDTYITSGPNTQLVDALFAQGNGDSFSAICNACTSAQEQAAIDTAAAYPGYAYTFTGTYSLASVRGATGSGTFNISPAVAATPEPSSIALLGSGLAGIAGIVRRRRR